LRNDSRVYTLCVPRVYIGGVFKEESLTFESGYNIKQTDTIEKG